MKGVSIIICIFLCACAGSETEVNDPNAAIEVGEMSSSDLVADVSVEDMVIPEADFSYDSDVIPVGERIDGPANIRDKKGGELIFELEDNTVVQIEDNKGDWIHLSTHCWLEGEAYKADVIKANTVLYDQNHQAIGRVFVDCEISLTDESKTEGYAYLEGYTHKDNIRPESLIENDLVQFIEGNGRNLNVFKPFIQKYRMRAGSGQMGFDDIFLYENWITDPSPGFRINLLFLDGELKGVFHSRDLNLPNASTHDLQKWAFRVSFFNDYPEQAQLDYVDYMVEWLAGVD